MDRVELYNFKKNYGLKIADIGNKKAVSLESIIVCRQNIESKYNEAKKYNILQSLNKIRIWEKTLRQHIEDKNSAIDKQRGILNKDASISLFDYIEKKIKVVSLLETINDFRFFYGLEENQKIDPHKFKRYLDCNHYQLDPQDFLKVLFIIEKKEKYCKKTN